MEEDRRNFKRIAFDGSVRYQQKGSQKFGKSLGRDFSNGGIGFISCEFFAVSTQLVFQLQHPQTKAFIKAVGEVVWISSNPLTERYNVGVKFIGPPLTL